MMRCVNRRTFVFLLAALPVASLAAPEKPCPVCGGRLVAAGSLKDDRSKPSLNLELWNRSSHGDFWPFHSEESRICSRCFVAYRDVDDRWVRASVLPESFVVPLTIAISGFPVPGKSHLRSLSVYSQDFLGASADQGQEELIAFWTKSSSRVLDPLTAYSQKHGLALTMKKERSIGTYVMAKMPKHPFVPLKALRQR